MEQDAWQYWYPRKEGIFEPEIPELAGEQTTTAHGVGSVRSKKYSR